jgi:hypothetical protein
MTEPELPVFAHVAIVTGGRNYDLTQADLNWLDRMWDRFGFRILLHGDCPTGVDRQAAAWARKLGLCDAGCPAQWEQFRRERGNAKLAGPHRNQRMTWACRPPLAAVCLAFPGGSGTAGTMEEASQNGVPVIESPTRISSK